MLGQSVDCFLNVVCFFVFFKQKTAYEMRISDWSSDVCSSDLAEPVIGENRAIGRQLVAPGIVLAVGAAARRIFPFCLGRQRLSGPFGIGLGIAMRDMDDRSDERRVGYECVRSFRYW